MTVPVCDPVLLEDEVELVDGGDEDDGVDGLEAVEPLSPLRSLPAHVDQIQAQPVELEGHVHYAWERKRTYYKHWVVSNFINVMYSYGRVALIGLISNNQ